LYAEEEEERGKTDCKLQAGLGTRKKNLVRVTSEPYINSEELTII